jgi:hypothetical protein
MSTIKIAYNTPEHLLVFFHWIMKNARYNGQDGILIVLKFTQKPQKASLSTV